MHWSSRILLSAVVLCASGCAPRILQPLPAAWPQTWRGRQLFHTPRAYIYAGTPVLAGAADRMTEDVACDFEKTARRPASKLFIVVTDTRDEPIFGDLKAFFFAAARQAREHERRGVASTRPTATSPESQPAAEHVPTDAELEEKWKAFSAMEKQMGINPAEAMTMAALPLPSPYILDMFGFPAEVAGEVGWVLLIPSEAATRQGVHKLMLAMLKNPEIGIAARIAMAPLVAAMEPKMVDMMLIAQKGAVFEQMARRQPDWTPEQASKLAKAYTDGRLKVAMQSMMADAKLKAAAVAASQPASAPATQPASAQLIHPACVPATRSTTGAPTTSSS